MTWYVYPPMVAVDASGVLVRNGSGQIYAEDDLEATTPLPITDINGGAISEVAVSQLGLTEAFRVEQPEAVWRSGGYAIPLASPKGMRLAAEAAATAAAAAASDAASMAAASPTAGDVDATVWTWNEVEGYGEWRPAPGGDLSDVTGTLAVENGGTGADNSGDARTALGLGNLLNVKQMDLLALGAISASGNSDVPGDAGVLVVTGTIEPFVGTRTITVQASTPGAVRLFYLTIQDGAGVVEFRNLTTGGTLLGSVTESGPDRTVLVVTGFQTTNWLPATVIEGGVSGDSDNALSVGSDGRPMLSNGVFQPAGSYVDSTDLATALTWFVPITIVTDYTDDPPAGFPDGGLVFSENPPA